jgi:cell division protein FtsI (penicillin-binding protein 3)
VRTAPSKRAGGRLGPARPRRAGGRRDAPGSGRRCLALLVLVLLAFAAIVLRLVNLQVLRSDTYVEQGAAQRIRSVVLPAQRGSILDRHGTELALSVPRQSIWADPREVTDDVGTALRLAPAVGAHPWALVDKLAKGETFVYLARQQPPEVAVRVKALDLEGVYLQEEPERVRPSDRLADAIIGDVDFDNRGQSGLELQYEDLLAGTPGEQLFERGRDGRTIPAGANRLQPPTRGDDLVLTLDRTLQWSVERALVRHVRATRAQGGMAVVMDPRSGEVLAMANVAPAVGEAPKLSRVNHAVQSVFEPGSINKIVTFAAALEEGVVRPDDRLDVPARLVVGGKAYTDDFSHGDIRLALRDALARSSNIGTIMLARELGEDRVDDYLRDFGLGVPTGLGFPRESDGILAPVEDWSGTSIGSIPIGQENAVTALQMLGAFNAIANGGVHVEPSLVRATVDGDGHRRAVEAPARRRVVSTETADVLRELLANVVDGEEGTGVNAQVTGYRVAGKTGTASKPDEARPGTYEPGAYRASFAGFLPVEDPRLSAIVVLDEPRPLYHGGDVAAPLFASVAQSALHLLRVPPPDLPDAGAGSSPATAPPRLQRTTD